MFEDIYKVWKIIAAGHFAKNGADEDDRLPTVVYTGCMRRHDKVHVLVKAIKISLINDISVRERCLLEAATLAEIDRPNIVNLHTYFEENGALYLEMELFDTESTLSFVIKEKNGVLFEEKQIGIWFAQICAALAHLHQKSLLHRNLQTKNVFLAMDGKLAKLGGFITPRPLNRTIETTDSPEAVRHLAPELSELVNEKTDRIYGPEADVWSLGVLLYEIAALVPPFEAGNQLQLFRKMAGSSPPEISENFSPEMRRLIDRLLDKTPNKRPTMPQVLMNIFLRKYLPFIFPEMLFTSS